MAAPRASRAPCTRRRSRLSRPRAHTRKGTAWPGWGKPGPAGPPPVAGDVAGGGRSHFRADRRAALVRGTGWGTGTRTAPSSAHALGVGEGQRAVEETWGRWRRGL